jgi:hypothetical protein
MRLQDADQFSLKNSHGFSPARQFGATFAAKGGKKKLVLTAHNFVKLFLK